MYVRSQNPISNKPGEHRVICCFSPERNGCVLNTQHTTPGVSTAAAVLATATSHHVKTCFHSFLSIMKLLRGAQISCDGRCYSTYPDDCYNDDCHNTCLRKVGSQYSKSSERKAKSLKEALKRSQVCK